MPRAAWRAWREAELASRMVCCARHTRGPTDRKSADAGCYLVAGICEMTASATSRIPSRRSMAVF